MSAPAGLKTQIDGMYRKVNLTADSNGDLPTKIELLRTGEWPASSNKGHLEETTSSLKEYKRNFDAGVAQSKTTEGSFLGLPIDYKHESWDKAAGWIKAMEVAPAKDPKDAEAGIMSLYADVEWTPAGRQAIIDGEFKCFSPSWWPASRGDWYDPEDPDVVARNVVVGGGLTNQPFFKGLVSLVASNTSNSGNVNQNNIIYIQDNKEPSMTLKLDEIRVLEASTLTAEQKTVLEENKAELSAAELTKFGLTADATPAPAADPAQADKNKTTEETVTEEQKALNADIASGKKLVVDASAYTALQAQVDASTKQLAEMNQAKVEADVQEQVKRGAIVADQADKWVKRIIADATMLDDLKAIPSNQDIIVANAGADDNGEAGAQATTIVDTKAKELIAAAVKEGQTLEYGAAVSKVLADNSDLAERLESETNTAVTA